MHRAGKQFYLSSWFEKKKVVCGYGSFNSETKIALLFHRKIPLLNIDVIGCLWQFWCKWFIWNVARPSAAVYDCS